MKPVKHPYDRLEEQALERLNQLSPPSRAALPRNSVRHSSKNAAAAIQQPPMPQRDLYILLRDNAYNDEFLGQLWSEVNTVPSWVCWEQIAWGQDCFYRYGGPAFWTEICCISFSTVNLRSMSRTTHKSPHHLPKFWPYLASTHRSRCKRGLKGAGNGRKLW